MSLSSPHIVQLILARQFLAWCPSDEQRKHNFCIQSVFSPKDSVLHLTITVAIVIWPPVLFTIDGVGSRELSFLFLQQSSLVFFFLEASDKNVQMTLDPCLRFYDTSKNSKAWVCLSVLSLHTWQPPSLTSLLATLLDNWPDTSRVIQTSQVLDLTVHVENS